MFMEVLKMEKFHRISQQLRQKGGGVLPKRKIYMAVTKDALSLPLAVADSVAELAELRGVKKETIRSLVSRGRTGKIKRPGYIVVDVFEKAWNQFSSLQMETRRSWLYASVRNACLNWLKHQQVEQTNVEALIEATRYDMSTRYEEHERLLQQAEQIARELKEPTCTILRLCYFEHLTYQQAADRLGISPNTVKKHISKALAILRERMKYTNIEN